jgi:hypothetical protein
MLLPFTVIFVHLIPFLLFATTFLVGLLDFCFQKGAFPMMEGVSFNTSSDD